jgi:hypothetical protein
MATMELDSEAIGVFMGSDGAICHSACWRPLEYVGVRGGLDVDFYCPECVEHLSLPMRRIPGIPMTAAPARRPARGFAGDLAYTA